MGAAYLAGLAVGYWKDMQEIKANWKADRAFLPQMESSERDRRVRGWEKAVRYSFDWAKDE